MKPRRFCLLLPVIIVLLAGCAPVLTTPPAPTTIHQDLTPTVRSREIQRLRVTNSSTIPLKNLVVRFPQEKVAFGDVPAGATTEYETVLLGVYRYAAYDVMIDDQLYQQPVTDWVGESSMAGEDFTYTIDVDPSGWPTKGEVIRLVEVHNDRESTAVPPTPSNAAQPTGSVMSAPVMILGKGSATALAASPDGKWLAVGTQFGVHLYSAATFKERPKKN